MRGVVVHARKRHEVEFPCLHPAGAELSYTFHLKSSEIVFSVEFHPAADVSTGVTDKPIVIAPPKKMSPSRTAPLQGRHSMERAGVFRLVFDNSSSVISARHVEYAASLTLRDPEAAEDFTPPAAKAENVAEEFRVPF